MSLADLSSKIYTIKSRKNLSLSASFTAMIREDLAMRYSVFNIVKSITGSEIIAQVAESKYGVKTPLQREEEAKEKRKGMMEKRFKAFTVNSLVNLNNKVNTLTALTEKNSALILNLYNDLGHFKNQRKLEIKDMASLNAVRAKVKSRTVKYQIDELKAQFDALAMMTIGPQKAKRLKQAAAAGTGFGFGFAAVGGTGKPGGGAGDPGTPGDPGTGDGGMLDELGNLSLVDKILLGQAGLSAANAARRRGRVAYRRIRRKYFPSKPTPGAPSTAAPVKPTPIPTAEKPLTTTKPGYTYDKRLNNGKGGYRGPNGRIASAAEATRPATTGEIAGKTPVDTATRARRFIPSFTTIKNFAKATGVGLVAGEISEAVLDTTAAAFQKKKAETESDAERIASTYGIKLIKGSGGTTIGFEINGKKYKYDELPEPYKDIIDAYISPDRVGRQKALDKIRKNPEVYAKLMPSAGRSRRGGRGRGAAAATPEAAAVAAVATPTTPPQVLPTPAAVPPAQVVVAEPTMMGAGASSKISSSGKFTDKSNFIEAMLPFAQSAAKKLGNPGLVTGILGQWAGESNSGTNIPADFNYAGIKAGSKYAKGSYVLTEEKYNAAQLERAKKSGETLERVLGPNDKITKGGKQYTINQFYGGGKDVWQEAKDQGLQWVQVRSHFAKFNSIEEFVSAYVDVLKNKRYAGAIRANNASEFGLLVAKAGYATADAQAYSKKVMLGASKADLILASSTADAVTAQLRRGDIQPLPTTTPGSSVATTPSALMTSADMSQAQAGVINAEINSTAAIAAIDKIQQVVVAVNDKLTNLEKKIGLNEEFPSVRNESLG